MRVNYLGKHIIVAGTIVLQLAAPFVVLYKPWDFQAYRVFGVALEDPTCVSPSTGDAGINCATVLEINRQTEMRFPGDPGSPLAVLVPLSLPTVGLPVCGLKIGHASGGKLPPDCFPGSAAGRPPARGIPRKLRSRHRSDWKRCELHPSSRRTRNPKGGRSRSHCCESP